jgi:Xaa-Pro aminopeptidase
MIAASANRIDRLTSELQTAGVDAFFAWSPVTMTYLHDFGEGGGERFLTLAFRDDGEVRMICPALSATQVSRAGIGDVRAWKDGEDPVLHFKELADEWNLSSGTLAVDDELPAQMLLRMQEALPRARFRTGSEIISKLMRVKEPRELDLMRVAGKIADDALAAGLATLKAGVTESSIEDALNAEMRRLGGKPAFCIVAAGANGAEPHHLSDETVIREGDVVVMDFGCTVDGYYSDITRMAAVEHASDEAKRVYEIVLRSHRAGRNAVRPGVTAESVDRAARQVVEDAGYGDKFMHRLGHGIGMRGHEAPNLVEGNKHLLEVGNCFSVEPGIYLPGQFGVRIENIVTVTEDGHDSLNVEPPDELVVVSST